MMRRVLFRSATLLFAVLFTASAATQTPRQGVTTDWLEQDYPYTVLGQSVRDALVEFGRNLSIPVVLADNVDGQLEGGIAADSAGGFLRKICDANGLAWFFDGSVLHVSSEQDLTSRIIDLSRQVDSQRTLSDLRAMQVGDPLAIDQRGETVKVAGPVSWVAAAVALAKQNRRRAAPVTAGTVRVFRGSVMSEKSVKN